MKGVPDLSIGQRLAIGFGMFMLVVAGMSIVFLRWHASSVQAHATYAERIAPLRDGAHAVERRIYAVGIALRSVLLEPSADRVQRFGENVSDARAELQALGSADMEDDGRTLYRRTTTAAQVYLQNAEALVQRRLAGEVDLEDERRIAQLRETLLTSLEQFVALQEQKAHFALRHIGEIRERTSRGLIVLVISSGVILSLLAWATAKSISKPTQQLLRTVGALREGNWKPALALAPSASDQGLGGIRDEMRQLGSAFGSAALALERREQRLRAEGLVAQAVASSLERPDIARAALQRIVEYLRIEVGVLYALREGSERLVPIASYALPNDIGSLPVGEGIPGQAALDRRPIFLSDIPADSAFQVKIGYDQAIPKAIAAIPLLFQDTLHGVLLLGSLREFSADAVAFLETCATQLGVGLQNAAAYQEIQRLLTELRDYNEKVQAQNEELQVQNEEIQAQNEEIQAQSEQLQAQHEELQAQNEELIQQGAELRRHAAELAEADERKNAFLGILAHELRNPMAPIANSIHILKRTAPGSENALRAQAVIERQAAHLVRLIDDLLDVTRISEGKIHINRERLDLVGLVRVCVEDLTAAYEQAGITLELDLPNTPVETFGDHTRLCQILGNLLNNSIKFNDRGGTVRLSLRVDHAAGAAVLRVSDDGDGMEPDLLPKLFQPFSQGAAGLARTKGGLGLGLALVRALVNLHHGSVTAHSDGPGRGAEFTVRLPLASGQAALQREHATQATEAITAKRRVNRVLVVEDNVDAARTLEEALRLEGYHVVVAHSGRQALDTVNDFTPDVVLCDIGLPDIDGHEVARELRNRPQTSSSILIALTGYASVEDKEQASAAGFDLHLAKPLKISSLEHILARLKLAN